MTFEIILLIAAGVFGIVVLGILIVIFLGFSNWLDKGGLH